MRKTMLKRYIALFGLITIVTLSLFCSLTIEVKAQETTNDINKTDEISAKYGFTLQEEKEIGFQSAVLLAKKFGYYKSPKVNEYVNIVGKNIASQISKRPGIDYTFYILDTPEINAFAVPGGFVFITKGALKILSNEAELAGILAHEIAHVELGHGLEAIASNPEVREKIKILKVNISEGKGFTQQSLKSLISKEGNVAKGMVNSGDLIDIIHSRQNENGETILEK